MKVSNTSKLRKNTIVSLLLQIVTIICGFILPRMILQQYGSSVNGVVNSIAQFLSMISFLELGVGAVVQSSLYKPLAEKNQLEVNRILTSAKKFFRVLAILLILYVVILLFVYPLLVREEFAPSFSISLIIIMSISSFMQYYFGIVDGLLLIADQKGYILYLSQIITIVLNTCVCVLFISRGYSIHIVKLATACIYLLRPLFIRFYINKNYKINRNEKYSDEPIKQKWNGIAQHIAVNVLDNTDTVVLTMFSTVDNVSIYSVYNMVVMGMRQLVVSASNGISSYWGNLLARKEMDELKSSFSWTEWIIHTITIICFGCTGMLIVPFIKVYTNGIDDVNYAQPLFAAVITLAQGIRCLRLPYNVMIIAGGHYKETQNNYIIAATINIVFSVITVIRFGLVGVAIGTLAAMIYQTIWMAIYVFKKFINCSIREFVKQCIIDGLVLLLGVLITKNFTLLTISYLSWLLLAIKVFLVWVITALFINNIFYKNNIRRLFKRT